MNSNNSQFTKTRLKRFLSYYKPHRRVFTMVLFFAALSSAVVLLFPLVSGYITKEVLADWSPQTGRNLMLGGLGLLLLTVLKVISNMIYAYFGHAMGAKMERTMRQELFAQYEKQSFGFHARNSVGKLMTVLSNDLSCMTELFHHGPEDLLRTAIKFIGSFVILININWPLTLILFSVFPLLCFVAVKTDRIMERALLRNRRDLSDMNQQAEDALSGIRTVKAFGNEELENKGYAVKNHRYTDSKCYFYKVEALFYEVVESYPQFLTMLTIFFGALFLGNGKLDVPVLVTFLLYVSTLGEPVLTMLNFMKLYEEGKAGFIRFMDMMELQPAVTEHPNPVVLSEPKGEIAFDRVAFQYEDGVEKVLDNVSITIPKGQTVAFVGASGIGKTTISALVARFYDVTEGKITIDGVDVRDIATESLRNTIGIVQQEVYIFNGTLQDNICYGKPGATREEVEQAARLANIHEFICSLPQGYDSLVGTRGILLSGGQRQRISLARLFLKNPQILILDEATSALDYESEQIVQQSIERLMEHRTAIVIAHRLSTIRKANTIFVLADKTVVEQGNHEELLRRGGEYARLTQLGQL